MKTLYIVRHGKSDWSDGSVSDRDRPINARGTKNAHQAGKILAVEIPKTERVIASSAKRTMETAYILCAEMQLETPIESRDQLYLPTLSEFSNNVHSLPEEINTALFVGHEPTISEFLLKITQRLAPRVITSSISKLQFDTHSWNMIGHLNVIAAHYRDRHDWDGASLL